MTADNEELVEREIMDAIEAQFDIHAMDPEDFAEMWTAIGRALEKRATLVERLTRLLDNLQLSASRVANKYGRDPETDELLDWTEWQTVRSDCQAARAALTGEHNG